MRYQNELLTFNDDVQGTAAVVMGAVIGASKAARKNIKEQQIVFVGAGSAAIGVADYLRAALRDPAASLLPSVRDIREVALEIAYAVALKAQEEGLAPTREPAALRQEVVESQWTPEYLPYRVLGGLL